MNIKLVLLLATLTQIACVTSAQASMPQMPTKTVTPTVTQVLPTATSQPPHCYTVTAEQGLHVRALPTFESASVDILTTGQGVTVTNQTRDIHGNTWLFIGTGWSRADWLIETECQP